MSNQVTAAVNTAMIAFAGLQALIGNGDSPETYRAYAILMPQDPVVPAVTFQRVSDERQQTMSNAGGNGVVRDRIRIISWAKTLASAQAVAEQVRLAMAGTITFESLHIFEADDYEADTLLYSVVSDYSLWYKY